MDGRLLTIAEASAALNVTKARVHQLLGSGDLDGLPLPQGRRRHAPNSRRVKWASVQRLIASTSASMSARGDRDMSWSDSGDTFDVDSPTHRGAAHGTAADRQPDTAIHAARAAAQEIKVRLDAMRDELRAERGRNAQLVEVAGGLLEILRSSTASAANLDDVTEGYSQALTQLLSPDGPSQSKSASG